MEYTGSVPESAFNAPRTLAIAPRAKDAGDMTDFSISADPIPLGLCQCGCGEHTTIASQSETLRGYVKGQPRRYVAGHHMKNRPLLRGYGYKYVRDTNHQRVSKKIALHVMVAEKALGHILPRKADIHHVDGNRTNNVNRNLVICQDRAYHFLLHVRTRIVKAGGDPNTDAYCSRCRSAKPRDEFRRRSRNRATGRANKCRMCVARNRRHAA